MRNKLIHNRGGELSGTFNPLVVGELFWHQSSKWKAYATQHVELVADTCAGFLQDLFKEKYPKDVRDRVWLSQIEEVLKVRQANAMEELGKLMEDVKSYPINYNSYYTDTVI